VIAEVAEHAPSESQRTYGTFVASAVCYLVLCILAALVCLAGAFRLLAELDRPGVDTTVATLIGFGAVSLISGFLVYGSRNWQSMLQATFGSWLRGCLSYLTRYPIRPGFSPALLMISVRKERRE